MMNKLLSILFLFITTLGNTQLPNYAPTSGLQGFYSFSGNILDNSGNGHNNANYNIISTTDRFNNVLSALYFSVTEAEYLNYGDVDEFEPYIASFSFWIRPESYGGPNAAQVKPIISKWADPFNFAASSYNVFLDGSNLCFVISDGVVSDTISTSVSNIPLNQWSHVVITSNYGFIKIYINNVLATDATSPISSINTTSSEFKVGGWHQDINASFNSFTGKIDDLGIWDRELDLCEIEALYLGVICATSELNPIDPDDRELRKITDLLGREIEIQSNIPLLYIYSDGSVERVYSTRE